VAVAAIVERGAGRAPERTLKKPVEVA